MTPVLVWCDVHQCLEMAPTGGRFPERCLRITPLPKLSFRPATEEDLRRGSGMLDGLLDSQQEPPDETS